MKGIVGCPKVYCPTGRLAMTIWTMRYGRVLAISLPLLVAACASGQAPKQNSTDPSGSPAATPTISPRPAITTLYFATKSGSLVTVRRVNVLIGTETKLFTYRERSRAEHTGNKWDELPPSLAADPRGTRIAYAAVDGLYVYDLASATRHKLVTRTSPGTDDTAASWSPSLGTDVFAIFGPRWSGDGRYLSFAVSHYEGHSIKFVDVSRGRVFKQTGLDFSYVDPDLRDLSWASAGASSAVPQNGSKAGVVLSAIGDPTRGTLSPIEVGTIFTAALSADARRIAFTYASQEEAGEAEILAVVRRGESAKQIVDRDGIKAAPAYDPAGTLWWVEGGTLRRWDGSAATTVARVDPSYRWEIVSIVDGKISFVGRSEDKHTARFLLLDANGDELAAHDTDTDYATLLGFD